MSIFKRGKKNDAGSSSQNQLTIAQAQLKQQAAVQKMRRGVADVSVSRQRLDQQAEDLQRAMNVLEAQAEKSRAVARDDSLEESVTGARTPGASATGASTAESSTAAQSAMARHHIMGEQLADIRSQRDALAEQEAMLIAALTQLQARVAGFNVTAETIKATHSAAAADHAIAQALADFDGVDRKLEQ